MTHCITDTLELQRVRIDCLILFNESTELIHKTSLNHVFTNRTESVQTGLSLVNNLVSFRYI